MPSQGLTVAVTGPTGDLGLAVVEALERSRAVKRVVGMARRPFDPASQGWRKVEYRQGDVQDRDSVRDAVKGADVVIHLAFAILGAGSMSRAINVDGSRNVFTAALEAGAERLCYASSVAAYGFHADNPEWLDEDVPARGSEGFYYSAQKAEVEAVLAQMLLRRPSAAGYVFRPSIVAGPKAQAVLDQMPYLQLAERLPEPVTALLSSIPVARPVLPDPGLAFQLVHEDDVASAFLAGTLAKGPPGPYNLAGDGTITMSDLARALGWYSVPIPDAAVEATAQAISRLPRRPEVASWIEATRQPVLMKTDRARRELGWRPRYSAKDTLRELVAAFRGDERAS